MKKIMIVEDDVSLMNELKILLENNGYDTECVMDFENVTDIIKKSNTDLILLDIKLPKMSGEYILKNVRETSDIPIIMVTSKDSEIDEVISMSYGADDYITKPYNPTILLLRIDAIFKRLEGINNIISYKEVKLDVSAGNLYNEKNKVELSKNEMKILLFLIKNKGKIVTRNELMDYLWSKEEFVDDNTLTVNINRIRKKLDIFDLGKYLETKRGLGYILL